MEYLSSIWKSVYSFRVIIIFSLIFVMISMCFPSSAQSWNHKGQYIFGASIGMESGEAGESVSISANGNIVAFGEPLYNGGHGLVRVFKWQNNVWEQIGNDLSGQAGSQFGWNIDLSGDGNTIVIGPFVDSLLEVFHWEGSDWVARQVNLQNWLESNCVSINYNGDRIAAGAGFYGNVSIFEWNGSEYIQNGNLLSDYTIPADSLNYANFGGHISMDSTGFEIAVSEDWLSDNSHPGKVLLYQWNGSNWVSPGQTLQFPVSSQRKVGSLSLSPDGNSLCVGTVGQNNQVSGEVFVYNREGNSWNIKGNPIPGEIGSNFFGGSVALNRDGSTFAVGESNYSDSLEGSGAVAVYQFIDSDWVQKGSTIFGDTLQEHFGYSIGVSADGNVLIGGAFNYNLGRGRIKVYQWNSGIANGLPNSFSNVKIITYPNPVNQTLNIDLGKGFHEMNFEMEDATGKTIMRKKMINKRYCSFNLNLGSGVYFLILKDGKGVFAVKKILKM